jgi:hypothetical protein
MTVLRLRGEIRTCFLSNGRRDEMEQSRPGVLGMSYVFK